MPLHPNDRICMKKPHPCGGTEFLVLRVGSQVRVVCKTCGRDMTLDRIKLEKSIRHILPSDENQKETETAK
ncbi:MAG: DUF951 domain-containing protein [Clostridia bacterium]|nr:DUF951 domain-containing protein [Clostridia bacterium]